MVVGVLPVPPAFRLPMQTIGISNCFFTAFDILNFERSEYRCPKGISARLEKLISLFFGYQNFGASIV